jgi:F0F1-type ATP synthase membrane subunit b/b'
MADPGGLHRISFDNYIGWFYVGKVIPCSMSETAVLWLLGIFVMALAGLVGLIYNNVIKSQDKADQRLEDAKDDADETHRQMWAEINKIKDRHAEIYKWRHNLTETRSTMENKIRQAENSIRVLAEIANELKNGSK